MNRTKTPATSARKTSVPRRPPQPAAAPTAKLPGESTRSWTFLTNHAHVLIVLYAEPGQVLREVANRVGITERAVQRIVQDLEEEGFIRREKVGRRNQYEVLLDKPLRHPIESHRRIGDLITLITD
jgi:predicted transcriptional regulator